MTALWDLHTHTTMSDGELLPIELIRRLSVMGYSVVAITDHADASNIDQLIPSISLLRESAARYNVQLLCGVEITHVPPVEIPPLARRVKAAGGDIVVVHGETPVEPVAPGTNHAACTCPDVDVLAHPGLITSADAAEAADRGIALEITSRGGHNRTNGYVVRIARESGCMIVVDSDAHSTHDLLDKEARWTIAYGAGLTPQETDNLMNLNIQEWLSSKV
jgi:histidinol phosphatase-like PHP family hydrolase